jgi:hypothetical protein
MILYALGPQQGARRGVQRVDIGLHVAEINPVWRRVRWAGAPNSNSGAHRRLGLIGPIHAAGVHINRVNVSDVGTDEYTPRGNRGLAES